MPLQDNITERRGFRRRVANTWAFAATDAVSSLIAYGKSQNFPARNPKEPMISIFFTQWGIFIIFENSSNEVDTPKSIWKMNLSGEDRQLLIENAEFPDWGRG